MSRGKSQKGKKSHQRKRVTRRRVRRSDPLGHLANDRAMVESAAVLAFGTLGVALMRAIGIEPLNALLAAGIARRIDDKPQTDLIQ
jgi:hypothetical protein